MTTTQFKRNVIKVMFKEVSEHRGIGGDPTYDLGANYRTD